MECANWRPAFEYRARLATLLTAGSDVFYARVLVEPVHFPGFAAIVGKSLLGLRRIRGDSPNRKPHQNHASVVRLLIVKVAATILKFAVGRNSQGADSRCGEIEIPLVSRRVVPAQREQLNVTASTIRFVFRQVGAPIP